MTEKLYRFAGLEFAIAMPGDMMFEDPYRLAPFAVTEVTQPHRFFFERVEVLPEPQGEWTVQSGNVCACEGKDGTVRYIGATERNWKNAYVCATDSGHLHKVSVKKSAYPGRITSSAVLEMLGVEHLMAQNDSVILHCSYIAWNGRAVLFTAPSGTGKSTQAELWKTHRGAEIINGDRAAVRSQDGRIVVEGLPFCGSSAYCENRALPLAAIVYLSQAPVTTIRRLRGYEAFAKLWEGMNSVAWSGPDLERASAVAETVANRIPVYHMPCTPDEQAVEILEKTLRKQECL